MSKKAIYQTEGLFFSKFENAKAEAEKNGNKEKPVKSFVSEEEFMTMLEDGLIVDFEIEGETQEGEKAQEAIKAVQAPNIEEVLKRLEALEAENKRLKEDKPNGKLSFEDIKNAMEKREKLQEQADELLGVKEEFENMVIEPDDNFARPHLELNGYSKSHDRISLEITNPFAIGAVVDELIKLISEKISNLMYEIEVIEKQVA